jgi:hypothetical protein
MEWLLEDMISSSLTAHVGLAFEDPIQSRHFGRAWEIDYDTVDLGRKAAQSLSPFNNCGISWPLITAAMQAITQSPASSPGAT